MPEITPRLKLPFIQPAQAQKHVTHNEAIEVLDVVVSLNLQGVDALTPPMAPEEGQSWALGTSPNDDWVNQDGMVASWRNNGWLFLEPIEGWVAWNSATSLPLVFQGGAWQDLNVDLQNISGVGINTASNATNPLSVEGDATLLSHGGAGHQLKVNKASASDVASLVYQSAFSGRAELGLSGNDDFSIKVSIDGSSWLDGLTVRGADAVVTVHELLNLAPRPEPASGSAGDVYFDTSFAKLRCFDGSIWQDLF